MRVRRPLIAVFIALAAAMPAFAGTPCAPGDTACRLDTALTLLHWMAAVLAIVLIAIVSFAVAVYRRNVRKKLTPDD